MSEYPTVRILLIDDNAAIFADFTKVLKPAAAPTGTELDAFEAALFGQVDQGKPSVNFDLVTAQSGQLGLAAAGRAIAEGNPFSVAFVDQRMPNGWDGLETIRQLWKIAPNLQVVLCTAYSDYSWQEIQHKLGRTDRLLILKKPFDSIEVLQLATALSEKFRLIGVVRNQTEALRDAAVHDRLTGLANRVLFEDRLSLALARSKRESHYKLAVMFIDFDRFKIVNDSLGHAVGDLLLQLIARRLSDTLAGSELARQGGGITIARQGGDEFILLLEGLSEFTDATRAADALLDVLATPYLIHGHEIRSTASMGITTSALPYDNCGAMVRDADTAMYRAKATGKAKYVLFDQLMHVEVIERLKLEGQMTKALEDREFRLMYQPVISLETSRLEGFEALLRWNNAQLGAITPARFVPVAEENGLIVPIGAWALEAACRQLAEWHRQFPQRKDLSVAVNLSRRQLISPDLLPLVRTLIATTNIDPRRLKLEITETTIMSDGALATRIINELRGLNIAVQMDDFGTGHSSLGCLNELPVDAIKIDAAFVRTVTEHRKYAAVVQAIGALARTLGVELIAEGVETTDQLVMLQAMDVPFGQGHVFAQPLEVHEAAEFIRASLQRPQAA